LAYECLLDSCLLLVRRLKRLIKFNTHVVVSF